MTGSFYPICRAPLKEIEPFRVWRAFTLLLAGFAFACPAVQAQDMQNMEAAMREAQALGASGADFDAMRDMMRQMQNTPDFDEESSRPTPDGASSARTQAEDKSARPNHFDVLGRRSDSDCEDYTDMQAFSFCQASAHAYLTYLEVLQREGPTDGTNKVYDAHVENTVNLLHYRDNFLRD